MAAEVDRDLRRWVEATRELGQRLLLVLDIFPMLGIIVSEGCCAGVRRGLLDTDYARAIREGVPCVVGGFVRWQGWSIRHRPLVGEGSGQREGEVKIRGAIPIMKRSKN